MEAVVLQELAPPCESRPDSEPAIEVSVVMPCLNEARTVGRCVGKALAALERLGVVGEVVVADNGSTDGSPELARAHGARVVQVEAKGYGSALQGGIAATRGRYVIMGDADDSYDFGALRPFVERLRAGDELVMGNRFKGGIRPGAMPWHHRYIGNPVLTGILNLFFRTPVGDAHCGMRAFRKEAYRRLELSSPGMEFASEMVVKAALRRQRISEVPIVLYPDGRDRPPHLRSFRDGWRHLRYLLLMCPRWLYLIPALLLAVGGLALMAWLTPGARVLDDVTLDLHSLLLGGLCLVLGHQTFWMWAFAVTHGCSSGLLARDDARGRWIRHLTLERCIVSGLVMLLVGLSLNAWLCVWWWEAHFGPLDIEFTMRVALWGSVFMILGLQAMYGGFFLSMLRLAKATDGAADAAR
jgi:hypothetical protein